MALVAQTWASSVVEDSRRHFIYQDEVAEIGAKPCESGSGVRILPEKSALLDDFAGAYRIYKIALPANAKPSVSLSKVLTKPLGGAYCKDDKRAFSPLSVGEPYLRDGLWISDVRVPLYEKKGSAFFVRKSFELHVDFEQGASGVNPGARALGRVLNKKAAASFGKNLSKSRNILRRAAESELNDVEFLCMFNIGDMNIASLSEDGLYAVEYSSIRTALAALGRGEDLDGIPLEEIYLYGANPDTLAAKVPSSEYLSPNQIFEIPIEIRDHSPSSSVSDATFGRGDSLLFLGYGTSMWKRCDREDSTYKNGKMDYFHSYSPYSFTQTFLLGRKIGGKGKRLSTLKSPSASGKSITWMRYVRGEKDLALQDSYYGKDIEWESTTGKEWFWKWHCRFDTASLDLSFAGTDNLPGFVSGGKSFVAMSYFPHRSVWAPTAEKEGDQVSNTSLSDSSYAYRMSRIKFTADINGSKISSYTLMPGGNFLIENPPLKASGNAYNLIMLPNEWQYDRFDGYSVAYPWKPVVDSAEWLLPGAVSGIIQIPVGKDSHLKIMKFKGYEQLGLLNVVDGVAKDSISSSDDVRYMVYRDNVFRSPSNIKLVGIPANREGILKNLSKINRKTEYLIVTPVDFVQQAYELAKFRSGDNSFKRYETTVVLSDDIYRFYTGGSLSPIAIRNFIAYASSVCPNLRYVLLAGTGHFDYRGSYPKLTKNFIPPYELEASISEDFFGILDPGEEARYGEYDVDVAVGRLPVTDSSEFGNYVRKVKEYDGFDLMDNSSWRSSLILAADDAKNGVDLDRTEHTALQEGVASLLDSLSQIYKYRWNLNKIYLLNYKEDASGQKREASQQMIDLLNQGSLMVNFFGHGSLTDWAGEGLMKASYIKRLHNKKLYTIMNSFSCTSSRFDKGSGQTLTQTFINAKDAGAIAAVGASRETFASSNSLFAKSFMSYALYDSLSTIGDAFRMSKNREKQFSSDRYNNEHYVLFGEPVLQMPVNRVKVSLDQKLDTIKALDKIQLSGSVSGLNEGTIQLTLREGRFSKNMYIGFEKDTSDNHKNDSLTVPFDGSLIYSEDIPVVDGKFSVDFVTPRKLSFGDTAAEFQAWAYSNKKGLIGRLWQYGISINGMSTYADSINDNTPPTIQIQSCFGSGKGTSFSDGQSVKLQAPACLKVVVEDSTALDFREQADEGLSFEIPGWKTPFHPYPYIEQSSKRAVVKMNFTEDSYPLGKYEFVVRAMDVLGNSSEKRISLEITDDMESGLSDVFNAPNPMGKKGTTFYFKNYAVNRDSKVDIFIYNQNGKLVKVLKNAVSGETRWDGRDNHGNYLANGLYHYIVRSKVSATGDYSKKTWTKKQKLLISR